MLGSPLYMAPEQMSGGADIDARADIWSLGVVLYELCTGHSPFFGESIPSVCARVIGIEPASPCSLNANLPSGLEAIILRCLRKEREQRPADIGELAAALAAYGSRDADAYAESALRVLTNVRTNPVIPPATSRRTPIALSATLAVLGQGLQTRKPRRAQRRGQLAGAALAFVALLLGALTLRAVHANEAATQGSLAQNNIAQAPPEAASRPLPSEVASAAPRAALRCREARTVSH